MRAVAVDIRILNALADEYYERAVEKPVLIDARKPIAGTRLIREWSGVEHTVTVKRDSFEYQGPPLKIVVGDCPGDH